MTSPCWKTVMLLAPRAVIVPSISAFAPTAAHCCWVPGLGLGLGVEEAGASSVAVEPETWTLIAFGDARQHEMAGGVRDG